MPLYLDIKEHKYLKKKKKKKKIIFHNLKVPLSRVISTPTRVGSKLLFITKVKFVAINESQQRRNYNY